MVVRSITYNVVDLEELWDSLASLKSIEPNSVGRVQVKLRANVETLKAKVRVEIAHV
jgi:LEA14-like dessication related protein